MFGDTFDENCRQISASESAGKDCICRRKWGEISWLGGQQPKLPTSYISSETLYKSQLILSFSRFVSYFMAWSVRWEKYLKKWAHKYLASFLHLYQRLFVFLPVATNLIFVSDLCFNFHQFSFLLHKSMLFSFLCLFNSWIWKHKRFVCDGFGIPTKYYTSKFYTWWDNVIWGFIRRQGWKWRRW